MTGPSPALESIGLMVLTQSKPLCKPTVTAECCVGVNLAEVASMASRTIATDGLSDAGVRAWG